MTSLCCARLVESWVRAHVTQAGSTLRVPCWIKMWRGAGAFRAVRWGHPASSLPAMTGSAWWIEEPRNRGLKNAQKMASTHRPCVFNKFRTNQLMSKLLRGIQMRYSWTHFDPFNHMREEQGKDAPPMHSSCYFMLCKIIGMTTGYRMLTVYIATPYFGRDNGTCSDH